MDLRLRGRWVGDAEFRQTLFRLAAFMVVAWPEAMLAKTGVHHFHGDNNELGTACGRYYRVSSLSITDPGREGSDEWSQRTSVQLAGSLRLRACCLGDSDIIRSLPGQE